MPKRTCFIGAFAALAALAVVGCGSSGTKTVTASTATTAVKPAAMKAQFVAQADEICKGLESQIAPLKAHVQALKGSSENSPSTYKALRVLLREDVTLSRAALKKLQALAEPLGETATIGMLLTGYSDEITDANNAATAVGNEESAALQAALAADKKAKAYDRGLAQGYGMKVCGKPESESE